MQEEMQIDLLEQIILHVEDLVKIVTIIMNVIQVHVLKIQLIEQRNVKVQEIILELLEINVLQIDNVKIETVLIMYVLGTILQEEEILII